MPQALKRAHTDHPVSYLVRLDQWIIVVGEMNVHSQS